MHEQPNGSPGETDRGALAVRPWLLAAHLLVVSVFAALLPPFMRLPTFAALIAYQAGVLAVARRPIAPMLFAIARLRWFYLVLIVAYGLLPGETSDRYWKPWANLPLSINVSGLLLGVALALQVALLVAVSYVVRTVAGVDTLLRGLLQMRLAPTFAHTLDGVLAMLAAGGPGLGGGGGGGGGGRGTSGGRHRRTEPEDPDAPRPSFVQALRGQVDPLAHRVRRWLDRGADYAAGSTLPPEQARNLGVLVGVAAAMMSFKLVKALPGIPFFSGYKTIFFIPLYVLAAELTTMRWGATVAGAVMGVVGFFNGDGRFGFFEIGKHMAAGVCVDLLWPFVRGGRRSVLALSLLGLAAACGRTATEFLVTLWMGARAEIYLFPAWKLIPNLLAGALSGVVCKPLLAAFEPTAAPAPPEPISAPTESAVSDPNAPIDSLHSHPAVEATS